ncbi:iron complex outermembrane receptor protein [Nitrospirillum amazonense]|uniref:Iron complex outermembrane receptor protein n=2 Tax=Nitrospirillum amazonense TaxID=28077 RepID=A0A560J9R7_9PROT|nr:iron complex outermembrane receptor protein [Nitrospirillum amazonense]
MRRGNPWLLGMLLSGTALSLVAGVAAAQTTAPSAVPPSTAAPANTTDANTLNDIIVTANRRAERIQDVPTAITAVSTDTLHEQNISTPQDLPGKIPSLMVTSNGTTRNAETVVIRGQGQSYLAPVGVVNYFAEVPLIQGAIISNQGGPGTFFDLESLQVLRGPQGTLFGKNTTGGALLLGPAKPTDKFEGYFQAQVGNYNDREYEGVINVPVDDKLAVRLSFRKVDRDGYTKDVGPQAFGYGYVLTPNGPSNGFAGKDYDDRHYDTVRLGVNWTPTERVESYLVAYYTQSHDNGTGLSISDANTGANLSNLAGNLFYRQPTDPLYGSNDPTIAQGILARQRALGPRETALNTNEFDDLKVWSLTDILKVDLTDTLLFRNIFGYQRMKQGYAWDLDGSILPLTAQNPTLVVAGTPGSFGQVGQGTNITNLSQLSVEPQIQGKFLADKLNTVVGLFYSDVQPEGLQALGSFNFGEPGMVLYSVKTQSKAVYAQSDLDLGAYVGALDGLKLTAGVRETWDSYDGRRYASSYFNIPEAQASKTAAATTWTVGLDYRLAANTIVYGKVTRGYKAGGFNMVGVQQDGLTYAPEHVTNYEVGTKTDFSVANIPVRLNATLYDMEDDGIQRNSADNAFNGFQNASGLDQGARIFNAGASTVRGVELELSVRPAKGLELSGSYAYMDAHYNNFHIDIPPDPLVTMKDTCSGPLAVPSPYLPGARAVSANLSCIPFPFAPRHQFNLNARYQYDLGRSLGSLVGTANFSWVDQQFASSISTPAGEPGATLAPYGLLNLSLEWQDLLNRPLDLRLFVTNATDKVYRISNSNLTDTAFGSSASIYGEPRMYGLSLRYRFGD